MSITRLKRALTRRKTAEQTLEHVLHEVCSIGDVITWGKSGGVWCRGPVIAHGRDDRIKVRNSTTGAEYWISADMVRDLVRTAEAA